MHGSQILSQLTDCVEIQIQSQSDKTIVFIKYLVCKKNQLGWLRLEAKNWFANSIHVSVCQYSMQRNNSVITIIDYDN